MSDEYQEDSYCSKCYSGNFNCVDCAKSEGFQEGNEEGFKRGYEQAWSDIKEELKSMRSDQTFDDSGQIVCALADWLDLKEFNEKKD